MFRRFNNKPIYIAYLPNTFQTSDIKLLSPKLKLNIHLTKSPKRDHIYKLFLYMLVEHNCLILNPNIFQSCNIAPILENNNLSYTAQNHSSVTILNHVFMGGR